MVTMVTRGILILKTRILSYLRTKAEFSNHHFCLFPSYLFLRTSEQKGTKGKSKDSAELKFRKIFLVLPSLMVRELCSSQFE